MRTVLAESNFSQTVPAGIWCENDVGSMSMRHDDVASTLIRCHFGTKCPLGVVLEGSKRSQTVSAEAKYDRQAKIGGPVYTLR